MAAITVPIMHSVYLMRKKFMVGMFETNRELGSQSDNGSVFKSSVFEQLTIWVAFLTCLESFFPSVGVCSLYCSLHNSVQ